MTFTGIPAEAFEFYGALNADNTKAFWEDNKGLYLSAVRQPLELLAQDLVDEFGEVRFFRPYRDIRFSKDKTPYKDHQGMYVDLGEGVGWYLQVSAHGLMIAGGWYTTTSEQLSNYRAAVAEDSRGQLAVLASAVTGAGYEITGDQLKSHPRGFEGTHPRVEWLRYRTLYARRSFAPSAWMGTRRTVSRVSAEWRTLTPLMRWLAAATALGYSGQPGLGNQD